MTWKQTVGALAVSLAMTAATTQMSSAAPTAETRGEPGGTGRCVTKTEFYAVYEGMKRAQVFQVFDSRGVVLEHGPRKERRRWFVCLGAPETKVWVKFRHRAGHPWRLAHKRHNAS